MYCILCSMVCDAILKHLDPQKEQVWRDGMAAIMTIIRNTDYVVSGRVRHATEGVGG